MTVSTTSNRIVFAGNSVATSFATGFPVTQAADLVVTYTDADGVDTVLTSGQYSATGFGGSSVTVTYAPGGSPIATGTKLTLQRSVPVTQPTSLGNQGAMWPATIEAALDRLTEIAQQLNDQMRRSITVPVTDADYPSVLSAAADRANSALLFDADGNPYVGVLASDVTGVSTWVSANILPKTSAAQVRAALDLTDPSSWTVANIYPLTSAAGARAAIGIGDPIPAAQGRLTLTTALPVMTTTVSAATVVYYTPYVGNSIPIWNGTQFTPTAFTELSNDTTASSTGKAGPAAVTTSSVYDLFVWSDSGTLRLTRGPAWTSATARGTGAGTTELQRVNGVLVNKVAITNGPAAGYGTYVGSVMSDGSSQLNWIVGGVASNGTAAVLGVWNLYNRVIAAGLIGDNSGTWTYSTATWRAAHGSNSMRVTLLAGISEDAIDVDYNSAATNTSGVAVSCGVALDSTSTVNSTSTAAVAGTNTISLGGEYAAIVPLGQHFYQAVEWSTATGTTTWYGFGNSGLAYRWRY